MFKIEHFSRQNQDFFVLEKAASLSNRQDFMAEGVFKNGIS